MQLKANQTEANSTSPNEFQEKTVDSPMQIRLINFLGLKNYLMEKFIFKRKPSFYKIRKQQGKVKLFMPREYKPPVRYELQVGILQCGKNSIPFVKLTPRNRKNEYFDTIVYAHGNSSDLSDALLFMERMALIYEAEYVVFDYNGYGQSRNPEVGEDMIAKDIEIILAWVDKPLNKIILWGFSLGSFPVISAAAKYPVKGIILQCPISSVGCFFKEDFSPQITYKEDYFSNLDMITRVKAKIFMVHSHSDEVIPIKHVQLLFDKYVSVNGGSNIFFIEVMKLSHNGIHKYIISQKSNDLQKQLLSFLDNLKQNELIGSKGISQNLIKIKNKTELAQIEQNQFEQDSYEIVQEFNKNVGIKKTKKTNLNCFCFPTQEFFLTPKEKFRSN